MTRNLLRWIARVMIGALLFTQLAVAAHACAKLLPADAATSLATAAESPMHATEAPTGSQVDAEASDCADMAMPTDAASGNVCIEHCHYGQQSDQASTLSVPAALRAVLYSISLAPETAPPPRSAEAALSALVAASPPHAILHCVFRI